MLCDRGIYGRNHLQLYVKKSIITCVLMIRTDLKTPWPIVR